jgi:hypothetical protein
MARPAEVWSEAKIARAQELLNAETIEEVCARLGAEFGGTCSPHVMRNRLAEIGIPWPGRTIANKNNARMPPWSAAKKARFRQLMIASMPKREIIRVLAVEFGARHGTHTLNRKAREMGLSVPHPAKMVATTAHETISRACAFSDPKIPLDVRQMPTLSHARNCQFPIGEPGENGFRFCEAPVPPGRSYCEEHHRVCYFPRFAASPPVATP